MSQFIDLHMHTSFSDGLYGPGQLLEAVRSSAVVAFAVTDHDTLDGYRAVKALLGENDPELISGIELSADLESTEVHLLAYHFDPDNTTLLSVLADFREKRNLRGHQIVERLNEIGLSLEYEDVEAVANGAAIGRPHVAQALLDRGQVGAYEEAFYKYIGDGRPAYVPKVKFSPQQVAELIHQAGGVVVLAHPTVRNVYEYLEPLIGMGLDGIETHHHLHKRHHIKQFRHLADRFGLISTGGSDFHGRSERESEIGALKVPAAYLEDLKRRVQEVRGCN